MKDRLKENGDAINEEEAAEIANACGKVEDFEDVARRELDEHDRTISDLVRPVAILKRALTDLEERVAELEDAETAHSNEESVQILDLRRRVEVLERITDLDPDAFAARIAASLAGGENLKGHVGDLERMLGMRNADLARLTRELEDARATVERTTGGWVDLEKEVNDLEATVEGDRESIAALVAEANDLRESVRRKDGQIAGFVEEVAKLRKAPTFAASAEAVIEIVLDSTAIVDGGVYVRDVETRTKLVAKVEAAFRNAASTELPERAEYAILCNNVVDLDQVGNFGGGDLIEEDFGDLPTASTRFDELTVNAAEVRLAMIVRRYRRWL